MSNGSSAGNPWSPATTGQNSGQANQWDPQQWKGCNPKPLKYSDSAPSEERPTDATIDITGKTLQDLAVILLRGILPRAPDEDEKTYVRNLLPQLADHCWWVRDDVGKNIYNSIGYCAAREKGELKWLDLTPPEASVYFENLGFQGESIPRSGPLPGAEVLSFSGKHMARRSGYRIGKEFLWESKLFDGPRILHHLQDLEGGTFGNITYQYLPDPWYRPACDLSALSYAGPLTYANKPLVMDNNVGSLQGDELYDAVIRGLAARRPVSEEVFTELVNEGNYPRLYASCWWIVDDKSLSLYNCHGWVLGVETREFKRIEDAFPEAELRGLSYYPIDVPTDNSIPADALVAEFETAHSARRSFYKDSQGWLWESKLQLWYRIIHNLRDMEGNVYGNVKRYWGKPS